MCPARRRAIVALAAASLATLGLTACGTEDGGDAGVPDDNKIIVYSGRSESLVKPLLEKFSQQTGVAVEARYGNTAQMAAQLLEEGKRSPADLFFAQDAGALGAVSKEGLFAFRLQAPKGYAIGPHTHPKPEIVTVITGTVRLGMGTTADKETAKVHVSGHAPAGELFTLGRANLEQRGVAHPARRHDGSRRRVRRRPGCCPCPT